MKILIVDDEDHIRTMMRLTLEATGDVHEAADGAAGLEAFGDGEGWDVVLLDQKMPGLEGTEILREMRRRRPDATVILVTAFASIDLVIEAMHLGATDFLRKPMTPETLRAAVAAAAGHPRPSPAISAAPGPGPIETLTMNGFHIRQGGLTRDQAGVVRYRFIVTRYPQKREHEVTVGIDPEAVARVARLTKRELPPEEGFWRQQAERLLAAFLWIEGDVPSPNQLRVSDISRADLDLAVGPSHGGRESGS